jgi:hypothetical protein
LDKETKEFLQNELAIIEKWEKSQKGLWIWDRLGRLPFKLLDKVTPAFLQKKISTILDEVGSYIQSGGRYLTKPQTILTKLENQAEGKIISTIEDAATLPLSVMDAVSEEIIKSGSKLATIQGASTGIGGIFTLSIDIPVLLGMSLKTLQDLAIAYGYDPNNQEERIFIVKCLQFANADIVGKEAILNELSSYYRKDQRASKEMMSQLQGWREVVYSYRDQFGWKKLFQMVPIAGMLFGALSNRSMIADMGETGSMLYRKRRIMERLEHINRDEHESN